MIKEYFSPELDLVKLDFESLMDEAPTQNVSDPEGYEHDESEIEL